MRASSSFLGAANPSRPSYRTAQAAKRLSQPPLQRSFASSRPFEIKKYTEDHEWIELPDSGNTGTIGVSKYAADALGDVVYVELPTVGLEVGAGDTIGAVESVKSASDIMTPVSGVVTEANSLLEEKPATINKSPEDQGWIARIQIENTEELESLMSEEEYQKFTDEVKADDEAGH
ncbi:hypothetical protein EV356DRAFT_448444 [Viridothelium virens]|uniref:Glycine cleavage system H protein n=1 Tax=Viridothelium virens TaxID=1048519 RepID=A0A6A6H611_VIRVR|nr:hypothetical protein EV356DRAFT_448444 [Viridothelium virens]